ncbi:translation initiation factor [Lithospermum erythrorhizon]|uniref:Translation initiation factor n=1 Tax=Lithospermum erythrorhizon TaxID=34254 RepID=A0AAV3NGM0_LITER
MMDLKKEDTWIHILLVEIKRRVVDRVRLEARQKEVIAGVGKRWRYQAERVIGLLLGSVLADGTISIRNSYAVPHNESSHQVALDIDYHHNMLASHQKVNPKEVIVGWFRTGFGVTGGSALIHEFYAREVTRNPQPVATQFQEIPLDSRMIEAERVGLAESVLSVYSIPWRMLYNVNVFCQKKQLVDLHAWQLGYISETVASLPKLAPQAFDKLVNDSLSTGPTALFLSSLIRTQLSLAEKLNTTAQIL